MTDLTADPRKTRLLTFPSSAVRSPPYLHVVSLLLKLLGVQSLSDSVQGAVYVPGVAGRAEVE